MIKAKVRAMMKMNGADFPIKFQYSREMKFFVDQICVYLQKPSIWLLAVEEFTPIQSPQPWSLSYRRSQVN